MSAKLRFIVACAMAFIVLMGGSFSAVPVRADTPPDVLDSYIIAIVPQSDGSLSMIYTLNNYCAKSDWPSEYPYLQIGVPKSQFTISDWGPRDGVNRVVNAEPINYNGTFVQLDFDSSNLPRNGDCFNLYFTIVQYKMAYPNDADGTVTFKFVPAGWNFPINVNTLTVTWALPSDPSLVKLMQPAPTVTDATSVSWVWSNPSSDAADMFTDATVQMAYDNSAFTLTTDATAVGNSATSSGNGGEGTSGGLSGGTILLIIVVAAVVLIIIGVVIYNWTSGGSDDSYSSGSGYTPSYTPTYTTRNYRSSSRSSSDDDAPSYTSRSSPSYDPPSRPSTPSGGYGGSSGHSSSCACASHCACACACAGGGRVGCSRKAIGVSCLFKAIESLKDHHSDGV